MTPDFEDYPEHVQQLIEAALTAADPAQAVRRHLHLEGDTLTIGALRYNMQQGRVFLIATGKASLAMGQAALAELQGRVAGGVIITKRTEPGRPASYRAPLGDGATAVTVYEAGHPVSDQTSVRATAAAIELLGETEAGDLVLCLISGGTSALLTQPYLPLQQWQELTQLLLRSGCTINELNSVRKELDRVKGGGLAEMAAPAAVVSLILSDVVGNPLDIIGSGPTAADPESPAEALTVLHRYRIAGFFAPEDWERITNYLTDPRTATSISRFAELEVKNIVVGDVRRAAEAAAEMAASLGFRPQLLTSHLQGEAREVGKVAAALARDAQLGSCLLLGGETTVTVHGEGRGGRNQELALAAAIELAGWKNGVLVSFATDGEDGPTDAAGALITGSTAPDALAAGLDAQAYLDNNDSYSFFQKLAEATGQPSLLHTGATGTNVNDLLLILTYEEE